jgi:hypothetical protein
MAASGPDVLQSANSSDGILNQVGSFDLGNFLHSAGISILLWIFAFKLFCEVLWFGIEKFNLENSVPKSVAVFLGGTSNTDLVKDTFKELGYKPVHLLELKKRNLLVANSVAVFDHTNVSDDSVKIQLLMFIRNICESFKDQRRYGGTSTPYFSHYYIDTLSAALNSENLELMSRLLRHLVMQRPDDSTPVDFVLVPKSGNVLLGHKLAQLLGCRCIYRKEPQNPSRSNAKDETKESDSLVNLEGLASLLIEADKRKVPMTGIAIDCNCSGGGSIIAAIQEWNWAATMHSKNISPVNEAFVLFRPDRTPIKRETPEGVAVSIKRYFDLSELQKKELQKQSDNDLKSFVKELVVHD